MIPKEQHIKIGLTSYNPCSYLKSRSEQVAVALDDALHSPEGYELLLANGFRRSGDTVYTPYCGTCKACEAIRIAIPDFVPSRSQKRLINKIQTLRWELKKEMDSNWFDLYRRYICSRHQDGTMYPPKKDQFFTFAHCRWLDTQFLHIYDNDHLIGIAVTDIMDNSASAFYTFFDPEYPLSLGTIAVLCQVEFCQAQEKQWLYLGYQIDECPAMNYKVRFKRHQRLVNHRWQG
ncbi:arginyltransferase [Vibrio albus]|uniref:Aspartate/glutamate leucyltransferase n=1 Tax=Vibrio albus TaxID=2200953 RepID=A0A2U3BDP3_9VIBR|nr:arginyltransferase [Vibrio albus]PWI34911.1 arginyltransferase [Vibrio albus]